MPITLLTTWLGRKHPSRKPGPGPRAAGRRRPAARGLALVRLEDRSVPSTIRTITYDQVTSLPASGAIPNFSTESVLSAGGTRAAFATLDDKVWTVNADGSGLTQVASSTHDFVDIGISADGSVVLDSNGAAPPQLEIHVTNADGTNRHTVLTPLFGGYQSINPVLAPDGKTVFFTAAASFQVPGLGQTFTPGLYSVPAAATNGTPTQLVTQAQLAAAFNVSAADTANIGVGDPGVRALGVSADGSRIVFGVGIPNASVLYALAGVNSDGSGLHPIGDFAPPPHPGQRRHQRGRHQGLPGRQRGGRQHRPPADGRVQLRRQ